MTAILRVCVVCVSVYAATNVLWIVTGKGYAIAYRSTCVAVLESILPNHMVACSPTEDRYIDTQVAIVDRQSGRRARYELSTYYRGYMPLSVLISMLVAVPVAWIRKLRAFLPGVIAICLVSAITEVATAVNGLAGTPMDPFHASDHFGHVVRQLATLLNTPFATSVIPLLIVTVLVFRQEDMERMFTSRDRVEGQDEGAVG